MKSLFSAYGTSGVIALPLYTNGTENVSWVKGIDNQSGSGFGSSVNTYTEGASFITLKIVNEPTGFIVSDLSTVSDIVSLGDYKRVNVDWEVISGGTFALIVSSEDQDDITEFTAKAEYGVGTGRKTTSLAINSLGGGSYYIRVNARSSTTAPSTSNIEIRIHKVWLEK